MAQSTFTYTVTFSEGAYQIDGVANPPLDLQSGTIYNFNVQAPGHPFYIKTDRVLGDGAQYDVLVQNNGADQGIVTIELPLGPVPKLFYQSGNSLSMGNSLTRVDHIDNSIKYALGDQLPGFVSSEYPMFQRFLEAYYEWLSEPGNPHYTVQKLLESQDVDTSVDLYLQHLEAEFLTQIPKDIEVDKKTLIKNIRSFYASKGTEKSYQFLFNILFNENVEFYYPKNDILRASDGKWSTVTSIRILNDSNWNVFDLTGKRIFQDYVYVDPYTNIPETRTWASATVERIIQFYLGDTLITEAYISNLTGLGDFNPSLSDAEEDRDYIYYKDTENNVLTFRIVPMTTDISVGQSGTGYSAGTILQVNTAEGDSGVGSVAQIASIFPGDVSGINIINAGTGYRVNDQVVFEDSREVGGSGAAAFVSDVSVSGMPIAVATSQDEDYRGSGIPQSPIITERSLDILNDEPTTRSYYFSVHGPGTFTVTEAILNNLTQTTMAGTVLWDYFRVYVEDDIASAEASVTPAYEGIDVPVVSNVVIPIVGDKIIRIELSASITGAVYDEGESPEISYNTSWNFLGNGAILDIKIANAGSGYRKVPTATISSATGVGASIRADGATIGRIKQVKILNQNFGALYYDTPTIDMTAYGNGDASVTMSTGSVARHPGIFSNDDGQLSEAKYLQDNKYYQTFSYVLRTGLSIENYRDTIKKLVHPSGMELFGEVFITNNLRAGMYNNFQNDPNDLIVSQRLGGLQIPKYKKTIMLFKKTFTEQVTYGSSFRSGDLYQPPSVVTSKVNIEDDTSLEYERNRVTLTLVTPTVGVDPTDINVFSFPVLQFPLQREVDSIIIDNTIEVTKTITRSLHKDVSIDVVMSERDTRKRFIIQKQADTVAVPLTSHITPEISIYAPPVRQLDVVSNYKRIVRLPMSAVIDVFDSVSNLVARYSTQTRMIIAQADSRMDSFSTLMPEISVYAPQTVTTVDTHWLRTITVGVGEIRDLDGNLTIGEIDAQFDNLKSWARDLSLSVRIDSRLVDKYSTQVLNIILDQLDVTLDTFRTLIPEISLNTSTPMDVSSQYIRKIHDLTSNDVKSDWVPVSTITGLAHENLLNTASLLNPTVELKLDLTVGVQREIHRHWTTHNYLLTSPQTVEVTPLAVEEKTNEITITVGMKELRDYADYLISEVEAQEIRKLDPTFMQPVIRKAYAEGGQDVGFYPVIVKNLDLGVTSQSRFIRHIRKEMDLSGEYVTTIHGSVPVESMLVLQPVTLNTDIELVKTPVDWVKVHSGGNNISAIDHIIIKSLDTKATVSSKSKLQVFKDANTAVQTGPSQMVNKNQNLFNGFIYKIEDNTIGSFDPDNTAIRSIANSQLVSTTITGYIRDGDNNILDTL